MVFYLQMHSYLLSRRVLKNSKLKVLSSYEKRGLLMYKVCMVVGIYSTLSCLPASRVVVLTHCCEPPGRRVTVMTQQV